jgi:hypothetical protein
MPDGRIITSFLIRADQIETFLAIGRHVNADHFLSLNYQIQPVLYGAGVPVPIGVDTASAVPILNSSSIRSICTT